MSDASSLMSKKPVMFYLLFEKIKKKIQISNEES